jgi:hypothetical protein
MSNENTESTETETTKPKAQKRQIKALATDEGVDTFNLFRDLSRTEQTIFLAQAAELMRTEGSRMSKALIADEDSDRVAQGDTVLIVSGDERFIGVTGTVTNARRTRVFVKVEGAKSPVYLFRTDVELVSAVSVNEDDSTEVNDSDESEVAEAV